MTIRKINISEPCSGDAEWQACKEPIFSGWLTQGPKVAEFEKEFSALHSTTDALATTSCTTALHLILHGLGIGPGDEVIVPAFSWVASANVILYCGATPVFADVNPLTYNLSAKSVREKISDKTKAVMVVHLFGLCVDMDDICAVIPKDIHIIEDAACAAGGTYKGQPAGSLGTAAAFSFHPRKTITTGEGGMVTTNNSQLAQIMQKLRNHGAEISEEQRHNGPRPYLLPEFNMMGFNYRMTDLQGAVGLEQLNRLTEFVQQRREWANYYCEQLADIEWLRMPAQPVNCEPAWQAFVTFVEPQKAPLTRNEIMDSLQQRGVATRPGTHAIHMLNYYQQEFDLVDDDFPNAKLCNDQTMAIPLHNKMTKADFDFVIRCLHEIK